MNQVTSTNPKVDAMLQRTTSWGDEFALLRSIALNCGLTEELKWGQPCYSDDGKNIVLIHGFKEYCAVLFFKGALLKDPKGILVMQTENVQSARQVRFTSLAQIKRLRAALNAYLLEAIEVERAGLKVAFRETAEFPLPEEFQARLAQLPALRNAFEALTPGRQRAYLLHFAGAKQSTTRASRVENCLPLILDGIGLNDR
ncbi:YdeI/OmpD-associated family protein [Massilia pseudoviolaceinigra]|uniref:YdeI/OmpD-associated family protein n=1 Tax=Massilia pseudoviolaceinigra TaxID=3057165 RepID=UPI0027966C43|nr:YdeI/OmpD-associated family protein [Massilia sp. CCM 9206]MDQ1920186.1 YdeI/OmpD-associated family protein [Massilia sp. CCM 9206]